METQEGMLAAIENLDGQNFGGRDLKINEACPRENNNKGGFSGGGGGRNFNQQNRSGGGSRKGQRGNKGW